MLDMTGYKIYEGDSVIVCVSGGTNSSLAKGIVIEAHKNYIKYKITVAPPQVGYGPGFDEGDIKRAVSEHRVFACWRTYGRDRQDNIIPEVQYV